MAKIIPTPFWKGYGFEFNKPIKADKTLAKWYEILYYLHFYTPLSKKELFLLIDKKGYQNPSLIGRRGWNSNVFSALANEEYIRYNHSTRKWNITEKGRQLFHTTLKNIIIPFADKICEEINEQNK